MLLVVGSRELNELAMRFVVARPGARSHYRAQWEVEDMVCRTAVDLVLLDVDASVMAAFVLAAHIRAADRRRNAIGSLAIVATTFCECKLRECLVPGSAINGAMKMPCDFTLFADFIDGWCHSHGFNKETHKYHPIRATKVAESFMA